MDNATRRQLLNRHRSSGFPGSIIDVFRAYDQGIDLIGQYEQQMQVANTPEQQQQGLRPQHQAGNTNASMAFPNQPPNASFNTVGMKAPIDIKQFDQTGNLVMSYDKVPPGVTDLKMSSQGGTVIETPAKMQSGGRRLKREALNMFPALEALGNVKVKTDRDFTQEKTGMGDIEYFAPGQKVITYPTGERVKHPGSDRRHTVLVNPDTNNAQSVALDMLHGLAAEDSTYGRLVDEFSEALGENEAKYFYELDRKEGLAEDGYDQWHQNYIDGKLRNLLFQGTEEDFKTSRYNPEERAQIQRYNPIAYDKFLEIESYLKSPKKIQKSGGVRKYQTGSFVAESTARTNYGEQAFLNRLNSPPILNTPLTPQESEGTIRQAPDKVETMSWYEVAAEPLKALKYYQSDSNRGSLPTRAEWAATKGNAMDAVISMYNPASVASAAKNSEAGVLGITALKGAGNLSMPPSMSRDNILKAMGVSSANKMDEVRALRDYANMQIEGLTSRGRMLDKNFGNVPTSKFLTNESVEYLGNVSGRPVVGIQMPDQKSPLHYYLSTGLAGKKMADGSSSMGNWVPFPGWSDNYVRSLNTPTKNWFNKAEGWDIGYGSSVMQNIGNELTPHLAQRYFGTEAINKGLANQNELYKALGLASVKRNGGIRKYQTGGQADTLYVNTPDHPRIQQYADSTYAYNMGLEGQAKAIAESQKLLDEYNNRNKFTGSHKAFGQTSSINTDTSNTIKGLQPSSTQKINYMAPAPYDPSINVPVKIPVPGPNNFQSGIVYSLWDKPKQPVVYRPELQQMDRINPSAISQSTSNASLKPVGKYINNTRSPQTMYRQDPSVSTGQYPIGEYLWDSDKKRWKTDTWDQEMQRASRELAVPRGYQTGGTPKWQDTIDAINRNHGPNQLGDTLDLNTLHLIGIERMGVKDPEEALLKIKWHETGPDDRMQPNAVQIVDSEIPGKGQVPGKGKGWFMYDQPSTLTDATRLRTIARNMGMEPPELSSQLRSTDGTSRADTLTGEQQDMLMMANLIASDDAPFKAYGRGDASIEDLWYYGVNKRTDEAKARQEFRNSLSAYPSQEKMMEYLLMEPRPNYFERKNQKKYGGKYINRSNRIKRK